MPPPLRLQLLGAPRFWFQGQQVDVVCDKPVLLLCYLAHRGDWVGREALTFLFWPDIEDEAARRNLRQLVHRAKSLNWAEALEIQPQRLRFAVHTDVAEFRKAVAEGDWASAVSAYGGPFMEGLATTVPGFEAWLALERENLQASWREAALHCAAELTRSERHQEAAKLLLRVWQADRLDEEVLVAYVKSAYLAGEREQALGVFETFSRTLQEELGVKPLETTQALAEAIRRGEALSQEASSERAVKLPPQATPFLGREAERADLGKLLARPDCRFLTIVGPGGAGKTRLALQLAAEQVESYPHGAYFVPLAALGAPEAIVPAVAEALGFTFYGARDPKAQLLDYLRDKALLLVIDNLEHLAPGAALLLELLEHAPELNVLATSRQRLDLPGVWAFALAGMPFGEGVTKVQESEAGRLFVQAARRAEPRFSLASEDMPYLLELCRLTEGLPLALELAAAWVRHLSLREIAEEVQYNLDVLAGEQGGMRAVFEHSWGLLSRDEQRALARLSVFRGGFTRHAAQQVAGASLYTLLSLAGKSLLSKQPSGRFDLHELLRQYASEKLAALGEDAEVRACHTDYFATFMAMREGPLKGGKQQAALAEIAEEVDNVRVAWQEALEQKSADRVTAMMESLASFYTIRSLFQEAEAAFGRAAARLGETADVWPSLVAYQGDFLHRQGRNKEAREFLQGRLGFVRQRGDRRGLAALLYALGNACDALGDYGAAEDYLQESLALYRALDDPYRQAHVLCGLGNVAYHQGDYRRAEEVYRESLALQTHLSDTWGLALTLGNLGTVADHLGNHQEARAFHEKSLTLKEALGDRDGMANSFLNLGTVVYQQGDYEGARALFTKSLGHFREIGNRVKAAAALNNLAGIGFALGDFEATRTSLKEALELRRELGDKSGVARCLTNLGLAAKQLGDDTEAKRLHQESLVIRREIGDQAGVAASLAGIGYAAVDLGAYEEARRAFHESLRIAWAIGAIPRALDALDGLAKVAVHEGRQQEALRYLSVILAHPASIAYTKNKAEELLTHLRDELPRETVAAVLDGEPLPLEDVAIEILSQDVAPYTPATTP
jgi:predicted ATPase/DNA-binding SARP family transcriptional activator/Tfp pilus assembly protein PilF